MISIVRRLHDEQTCAGASLSAARAVAPAAGVGSKEGLMMNRVIRWPLAIFFMTASGAAFAQGPGAASPPPAQKAAKEIPLYPGAAPGSEKWDWQERSVTTPTGQPIVTDVVRPVLLHYPADKGKAVGAAMIVAPGGGFRALMMSYEGEDIARRLNAMGVDAFVLKYRLIHNGPGATGGPARQDAIKLAADDGRQAVRLVRGRASEFGYRPDRVGMIGFSAGGMVTSEALFGPGETRPDFAAIIYGAREVKDVPSPAPPLFLAVAADDAMAVGRTIDLFTAYRKGKGPAELHVFQMGAHGFVHKGGGADHFMDRLEEWLAANKLLSRSADRAAATAASPRPAAVGVAGRWRAEFDSPVGLQKYDYEFTLDGETLTGKATGQRGDEKRDPVDIKEGKVKGGDISFVEMITINDMEVPVRYTGKISGDEIRFKREVGEFATLEIVAKRVKGDKATDR
jgi:acetyl esterase/lipase